MHKEMGQHSGLQGGTVQEEVCVVGATFSCPWDNYLWHNPTESATLSSK